MPIEADIGVTPLKRTIVIAQPGMVRLLTLVDARRLTRGAAVRKVEACHAVANDPQTLPTEEATNSRAG